MLTISADAGHVLLTVRKTIDDIIQRPPAHDRAMFGVFDSCIAVYHPRGVVFDIEMKKTVHN